MSLKPDFHEAKKFERNLKEDIALVENDLTLSVMSFSTNAMSSFRFRSNFFASRGNQDLVIYSFLQKKETAQLEKDCSKSEK